MSPPSPDVPPRVSWVYVTGRRPVTAQKCTTTEVVKIVSKLFSSTDTV
jgi:hypothetical protein